MNPRFLFLSSLAAILFGVVAAAASPSSTPSDATQTTVTIPTGTVVGSIVDGIEYYRGIPFAQPPTGSLRLKPPVRLGRFDTFQATGVGPACPQMTGIDYTPLLVEVVSNPTVADGLFLGDALGNESEDCLTISVMRPQDTRPDANLPVLFWIYGGAFELGSPQAYNASVLIPRAVAQDQPFIFVAVNYRLGGFGFLGGSEVLADGSANLGLLDQRMGLEWVADNIAAFGGDPDAVTIWGESVGAVSVFDQLALYDGDNTYKGRPLFRAAIMNSGSIYPAESVDGAKAQAVFDIVVEAAGCSSSSSTADAHPDKLACLRAVDYETYLNATNVVPTFLSYDSLALNYMARPDGNILTASADVLARSRKYAAVPVIIGDVEDEGTLFALFQANITTEDALVSYLNDIIFPQATREQITALVNTHPDNHGSAGSPFGTGTLNEAYPEFKRLAAILGDLAFILTRRVFLETLPPWVSAWSYLATWNHGTPIMGTFHTADLPRVFYGTDDASLDIQDRYIAFVTSLNPNKGLLASPADHRTYWPTWQETQQLMEFGANLTGLICDDFRAASFEYIRAHLDVLRF